MTGGCLLVAFAPDGATGNDDDDDRCGGLMVMAVDSGLGGLDSRWPGRGLCGVLTHTVSQSMQV